MGLAGGLLALPVAAQEFEQAVHDVGNAGLTVTNAGYIGNNGIQDNPAGPPSFEYPLDSGIEHLFEAGLWVGGVRADGLTTVRTGSITRGGGYQAGAAGFEFAQANRIAARSSLPTSPNFAASAVSQEDFLTAYADTFLTIPGTFIQQPSPEEALGLAVEQRSYAWSFPFTEAFVIVEMDIQNVSNDRIDSVYVGLWHNLVVRNILTTTEGGSEFFSRGGFGALGYPDYTIPQEPGAPATFAIPDSQLVSYAFNAGGDEETLNTYGSIAFLGAEWPDPVSGAPRFFHPFVQDEYRADGLSAPQFNPRWWQFGGGEDQLARPDNDLERYDRMARPFPDPATFESQAAYEAERNAFLERIRVDGQSGQGNWIGMTAVGPFASLQPGATLTATFAFVAALKPETFQGQAGKPIDTPASQAELRENVFWAQRTYAGEDLNYNGRLDAGEDANGNGLLDRYLIPEPPPSPQLCVEAQANAAVLYWTDIAETTLDPVSGRSDFEGYRVYRTDPGDDLDGALAGDYGLVAEYDRPANGIGFDLGLPDRVSGDDATCGGDAGYAYRLRVDGLLNGWQYGFSVTAFDSGDEAVGLASFESGRVANAVRVFPGTSAAGQAGEGETVLNGGKVGVYPNPYRLNAAWAGSSSRTQRLNFYNLPARSQIRVFTLSGELVAELDHDAATYNGDDAVWYGQFAGTERTIAGGEHSWDLLSDNQLQLATGLYFYSVEDLESGETQTGKFVILR